MRIILAHDWFTQYGGAERVMGALHEEFPESPIYTLVIDPKLVQERFASWDIRPSVLQFFYKVVPRLQYLLPFIPFALRLLRLPHADVVVSSSSSFMKGLHVRKGVVHINYCHTPTRFVWSDSEYIRQETPRLLLSLAKVYLAWFRTWDLKASRRVTHFIANSKEVQGRIKKYYNRDSEVIYPFVDTSFWQPTRPKQDYFLVAGRLQAHKNNELVIKAFNELGLPLHVVGTGRQEEYLKSIAKPNITFLGRVSDEELRDEYSGALGLIYPQLEDFGMMPLEAASCGTPTLAWARGGSLETVVPGVTGELFEDRSVEEIIRFVKAWNVSKYSYDNLRAHADKFGKEVFKKKIREYIENLRF